MFASSPFAAGYFAEAGFLAFTVPGVACLVDAAAVAVCLTDIAAVRVCLDDQSAAHATLHPENN